MKASEYIFTHPVFTTEDIRSVCPSSATADTTLRRAVKSGKIERIRRGLYASKSGAFRGVSPDPMEVAMAADSDAVISYLSALAAHGLSHNVAFECMFRSGKIKSGFEYAGVRYVPFPADASVDVQRKRGSAGDFITVTTREQTLVDCLAFPNRAGGPEEVIRALSAMPYLDLEKLGMLLDGASASVRSRAGWLLEANRWKWHVDDAFLEGLVAGLTRGATRFGSKGDPTRTWSKRWSLAIPFDETELREWMT